MRKTKINLYFCNNIVISFYYININFYLKKLLI